MSPDHPYYSAIPVGCKLLLTVSSQKNILPNTLDETHLPYYNTEN